MGVLAFGFFGFSEGGGILEFKPAGLQILMMIDKYVFH